MEYAREHELLNTRKYENVDIVNIQIGTKLGNSVLFTPNHYRYLPPFEVVSALIIVCKVVLVSNSHSMLFVNSFLNSLKCDKMDVHDYIMHEYHSQQGGLREN